MCCFWTSDMCLAPLHRFRASRGKSLGRKLPGRKFLVNNPQPEVYHGPGGGGWVADPFIEEFFIKIRALMVGFGDALK